MEREYIFYQNSGNGEVSKKVKESELTKSQKDLLAAELVKKFSYMPDDVQKQFVDYLIKEERTRLGKKDV